jgi:hypothetical protein
MGRALLRYAIHDRYDIPRVLGEVRRSCMASRAMFLDHGNC